MGFVSCLEDVYKNLENSVNRFSRLSDELPEAQPARRAVLKSELLHEKSEVEHFLKALETQILEMMTDPQFEVYAAWRDVTDENERLKAERDLYKTRHESGARIITLSAYADPEVKRVVTELERTRKVLEKTQQEFQEVKNQLEKQRKLVASLSGGLIDDNGLPVAKSPTKIGREESVMEREFAALGVQRLPNKKSR